MERIAQVERLIADNFQIVGTTVSGLLGDQSVSSIQQQQTSSNRTSGQPSGPTRRSAVAWDYLRYGDLSLVVAIR